MNLDSSDNHLLRICTQRHPKLKVSAGVLICGFDPLAGAALSPDKTHILRLHREHPYVQIIRKRSVLSTLKKQGSATQTNRIYVNSVRFRIMH